MSTTQVETKVAETWQKVLVPILTNALKRALAVKGHTGIYTRVVYKKEHSRLPCELCGKNYSEYSLCVRGGENTFKGIYYNVADPIWGLLCPKCERSGNLTKNASFLCRNCARFVDSQLPSLLQSIKDSSVIIEPYDRGGDITLFSKMNEWYDIRDIFEILKQITFPYLLSYYSFLRNSKKDENTCYASILVLPYVQSGNCTLCKSSSNLTEVLFTYVAPTFYRQPFIGTLCDHESFPEHDERLICRCCHQCKKVVTEQIEKFVKEVPVRSDCIISSIKTHIKFYL